MGFEAWLRRREKLTNSISAFEQTIRIDSEPVEWKLFNPPTTDKIIWYMFLVDILGVEKTSDDPFESHRIYPIFAAIGDQLEKLKLVPNVHGVIKKLLSSKHNQPDNFLFELLVASHYLRNGYDVAFIEEQPTLQTPDLQVSKFETSIFVECKRLEKITVYADKENKAWDALWKMLSIEMVKDRNDHWIDITFKIPPSKVKPYKIIKAFHELAKAFRHTKATCETVEFKATLHAIDMQNIENHFSAYSVRANSPQIHALIFGDVNPNEKRSTATIPTDISRPGLPRAVLNIFLEGIAKCAGAQWRCTSPESVDKRSKHFKTIIKEAASQIPANSLGIIHTFYETSEGVDIEIARREKLISALTELQIKDKTILVALIHGVKHYPNINGFEWAETIQDFSAIPDILDLLFEHFLLLGFNRKGAIKDETHWEQDAIIQEQLKTYQPKG
jgi:hypothetical protein